MEIPAWLNTEFLAAALDDGQDDVHILKYEVTPAVPEGSNYLGRLFRVKLSYKNRNKEAIQNTSIIVKAPLINSIVKEFADKLNAAAREAKIYKVVLPLINRYLGEDTLSPKNYFSLRNDVLVLEDLNHEGYIMCDRIKQLDHDHCVSVIKALARFHASTVALHEANPELIETVAKEVLFAEDSGWYEHQNKYVTDCYTCTANVLKTVKSYERFGDMVLKEIDTAWHKLVKFFSKGKHIKVMNHGDVWTNNMLFKHDERGRVSDVKFVDFQMCRYASLGADIKYFLTACPNADVRRNGFGDLLEVYRNTLNATLVTLNCKMQLSVEELEKEVKSAEPFEFFLVCTLLPIAMADPENPPKPAEDEEVLESHDPKMNSFLQMYHNDRYLDLAVEHLKRLETSGYFN